MKLMFLPVPSPRRSRGFTLVELLTVIAIISILMAILFPVAGTVKESMRRAEAANTGLQIVTAVKAYNTDYGKYPRVEEPNGERRDSSEDTFVGDQEGAKIDIKNSELFYTLRNIDAGINSKPRSFDKNPRHIVYFQGRAVANPASPRSGFLEKASENRSGGPNTKLVGCLFDPWGTPFNVVMDTNEDGRIKVSEKYKDFPYSESSASDQSPRAGVGAFALGKDQKLGNNGDNYYKKNGAASGDVVSWQ